MNKIRLGVTWTMSSIRPTWVRRCSRWGRGSAAVFDNVLTFSGDTGTVVYTQTKVLENLPMMLTSPKIWEALGLPLTPFEDSIDFFWTGRVAGRGLDPSVRGDEGGAARGELRCRRSELHPGCGGGRQQRQAGDRFRHGADRHPELRALSLGPGHDRRSPNINSPSYIRSPIYIPQRLRLPASAAPMPA